VPYSDIVENTEERDMVQVKIWRMRIAFWIHKFTDTHCEYVILTAFPLQQWLYKRPSNVKFYGTWYR